MCTYGTLEDGTVHVPVDLVCDVVLPPVVQVPDQGPCRKIQNPNSTLKGKDISWGDG